MAGEDQGQPCTQTRWERGRLQAQSKAEGPVSWRLQRSLRALTSRATRGAGDRVQLWAGPAVPRRGWPSGRGLPAQGLGCSVYCEGVGEPWKGPRQGQFWTTVEDGQETRRPGRKSGPRSRALNPISILMMPPQTTPLV